MRQRCKWRLKRCVARKEMLTSEIDKAFPHVNDVFSKRHPRRKGYMYVYGYGYCWRLYTVVNIYLCWTVTGRVTLHHFTTMLLPAISLVHQPPPWTLSWQNDACAGNQALLYSQRGLKMQPVRGQYWEIISQSLNVLINQSVQSWTTN